MDPEREGCVSVSLEHEGYVYFVRCVLNGYTKIGYSWENPEARFLAIQADSPVPVERHAIMEGSQRIELDLHCRFGEHWDHAEWFKPNPELEAFIVEYTEEWLPGIGKQRRSKKHDVEPAPSPPHPVRRKPPEYELSDEDSARYMLGLEPGEKPPKPRRLRYGPLQKLLDKLAAEKEPPP
jgi:hypothetical protein